MENPLVSIVSGTYNRLKYLQVMVQSVRNSAGVGIPYEIVLVDGGSSDGTIEWCRCQNDIVLIEQKKLLGAVKAFNAGFRKAIGEYVIIGNDDIEFMDGAIYGAISFMERRPDVGIGCFCQDRGGREFHVEYMPAVQNGYQISVPYGQVCIIPRKLGDKVGWWGNYLHTYGGDNELSCNVYEAGYKIEIIEPCCCVHDYVVKDELRSKNLGSVSDHPPQGHPDTNSWISKWTRSNGLIGPEIKESTAYLNTQPKVSRVLYAPIYDPEVNTELVRKTKFGLREALQKEFHVLEIDYYRDNMELFDAAEHWKPDIFILQLQDTRLLNYNHIKYLRSYNKNSIFLNWNGDFHPDQLLDANYMKLMSLFDISMYVTTFVKDKYDASKINWRYWQIGYEEPRDPEEGKPRRDTPRHDILLLGNGYHKERVKLGEMLRMFSQYDVGIYGNWSKNVKTNGQNLYDFAAGFRLYKNCKIAISDSVKGAPGFVSNRFFQALSAGAFLLQQHIDEFEHLTGLKSGVHYVEWFDLSDLKDKILYYLSHDYERRKISKAGEKAVRTKHSFDVRVNELKSMLRENGLHYISKSGV